MEILYIADYYMERVLYQYAYTRRAHVYAIALQRYNILPTLPAFP